MNFWRRAKHYPQRIVPCNRSYRASEIAPSSHARWFAPALAQAERQYRATLPRVILYATAADQLSHTNRFGSILDAQRFELHVPFFPRHDVFDSLTVNRFEAHADFMKLQTEAEQLIGFLLRGTPMRDLAASRLAATLRHFAPDTQGDRDTDDDGLTAWCASQGLNPDGAPLDGDDRRAPGTTSTNRGRSS